MRVDFDVLENGWHRAACSAPSFHISAQTLEEVCAQIPVALRELEAARAAIEAAKPVLRVVK